MKPLSKLVSALPVSAALAVDLRAKALLAAGRDVVSFCVGEPDFAAPLSAREADIAAVASGNTKYTNAAGTKELRAAIAHALLRECGIAYGTEEIAVTSGAKYAVYAAVRALADPGDEIVLPAPYWTSYIHIIRLAGAVPVVLPCGREQGCKLTPDQLSAAVTDKTKALILNNPNNPSGAVYSRDELSALAEVCRACDLYVIADEIYSRLLYTDVPFCAAASVSDDMRSRTVSVNGVSKAYAMTGWRIGFAACRPDIAQAIGAFLSHTTGCPNTMAQKAAAAALLDDAQSETKRMRSVFLRRRDALLSALSGVPGVRFLPPDGAFYVLLDIGARIETGAFADDADFALRLLSEENVAVVPCADYGAPCCVRLAYTLEEARIREGVLRLARFIERNQ